jgi:hypothetical protein
VKLKEFLDRCRVGRDPDLLAATSGLPSLIQSARTDVAHTIRSKLMSESALPAGGVSAADAQRFEESVGDIVASDAFLEQLSEEVGEPKAGETEEEFVTRAKAALRSLMRESLTR